MNNLKKHRLSDSLLKYWIPAEEVSECHKTETWVKIVAKIRNNETGEIREHKTDSIFCFEINSPLIFIWEDGNYACDCNRQIFFDGGDIPCGDEKFSVNLQNPKTKLYYYREFED